MAEVSSEGGGGGKHKGGKPKGKKSSTHIDMTPMVDLAFLLLTFFMLTASFSKPKTMEVQLPDKTPNVNPIKKNPANVMNLLVGPDNKLMYYFAVGDNPKVEVTNYGVNGLQAVLSQPIYKNNKLFMVLVKATPDSKYKNLIQIFDILRVTGTVQAVVDITPQEIEMVKNTH